MDGLGVLDLRCFKKDGSVPQTVASSGLPLDLRTTRSDSFVVKRSSSAFSSRRCLDEEHNYVQQTPPKTSSLPSSIYTQKSRWNHRSHPSLDSDSSFESEQESDARSRSWFVGGRCNSVIDTVGQRRYSVESPDRRESVSSNDHQDSACTDTDERESCGSGSAVSLGFYKELPELTANVSLKQAKDKGLVLHMTCEAEVLDAADVHSELIGTSSLNTSINVANNNIDEEGDDDDDDNDDGALQVDETASCFEELLQIQLEVRDGTSFTQNTSVVTSSISAGIQEAATKCIKEIQITKKDLFIGAQNFQGAGNGKRFYCSKCSEEFYNMAALWQHLMTHPSLNPGEKLIKCPVCTKRFSTVNTLERHMLSLHTGEMKFVCNMCDTPFKFRTHLRKHLLNTRCSKGAVRKKKDPLETVEKFIKRGAKKRNSKMEGGCIDPP